MPLRRIAQPFDHPDWIFELKYNGFRALAYIEFGRCRLVSRNGNTFASFRDLADRIGRLLPQRKAVLDGEIVCLNENGHPQFEDLLFRRGMPTFVAFDLLFDAGKELRYDALIDRKLALRRLLSGVPKDSGLIYAEHIEQYGKALFERICALDLEGIVAKHNAGAYASERDDSSWVKVLDRNYSQRVGRDELFERDRQREPVPGWHACELACEGRENTGL